MRTKSLTYILGEEGKELEIDVAGKAVHLSDTSDTSARYSLNFSEFFAFADLAADLRRNPALSGQQARPTQPPAQPPAPPTLGDAIDHLPPAGPAEPGSYTREAAKAARPATTYVSSLENRDLSTKDMYVVTRDGFYFSASGQAGQIHAPDKDISQAKLFETAEDAHAVCQTFPGAGIRLFSDVAGYHVVFAYPDNTIKFWVGNGVAAVPHVNASQMIIGRQAALMTLQTVAVPPGARAFLLPYLA